MNYGVILAGGSGTRVTSASLPKQFLPLGGKALLTYSVERFCSCADIDRVIVSAPEVWIGHTRAVLDAAGLGVAEVCAGGVLRQDSLYLALKYIESRYGLADEDLAVSHDAARPFVNARLIRENIEACRAGGAADTVLPSSDTIVVSGDGRRVERIPPRASMYLSQTPQSFFIKSFLSICADRDADYLKSVTDAARILHEAGVEVALVMGEQSNIKITTDFDLRLAQFLLDGGIKLPLQR
ncbi:MAG: 2-C-methyl-D-erythritol 4-phosphate cytidylyltransferase [Desulfovibrio sp.]|jgi:2-C-methyl-D-erythritol 4-phosphate cytidylyltransferase|nr:2-C-methyl-D-erythritol 4-phosphate cytidylyltransferase [Desulfovibrio sp.]